MNIIIILLIFCSVLFLYIHIYFHLKTSNDLEVYEISNVSKDRLEEICDLRQAVVMDYAIDDLDQFHENKILSNYGSFDVKLRNTQDLSGAQTSEIYMPIIFKNAIRLLNDNSGDYISENNMDFLDETGLSKVLAEKDAYFRPPMLAKCYYDLLIGSNQAVTPFKYNLSYRNYFIALNGRVTVKLSPPKSQKYLHSINDYDNFEFRSKINPWNVSQEFTNDFEKIKCMEVVLEPGKIIFIPAYWWYSFKFEERKSSIISLKYLTFMNIIAISRHLFLLFLQKQNIKHNFLNKSKLEI